MFAGALTLPTTAIREPLPAQSRLEEVQRPLSIPAGRGRAAVLPRGQRRLSGANEFRPRRSSRRVHLANYSAPTAPTICNDATICYQPFLTHHCAHYWSAVGRGWDAQWALLSSAGPIYDSVLLTLCVDLWLAASGQKGIRRENVRRPRQDETSWGCGSAWWCAVDIHRTAGTNNS